MNKLSYEQYKPFFESNQEFDVLFFGSSHMYYGVSPLDLYHNYGITSYNLSMLGNYIPSNYYRLREVLDFLKNQKRALPKTVVVDIFALKDTTYRLHSGWDAFPISLNKVEMTRNLVPEEDRAAMLVPFLLYHNRWNELTKGDFQANKNTFYGMGMGNIGVSYPDKEIITNPMENITVDTETIFYLDQIEKVCDELGIQLILIHIPYSAKSAELQKIANGICLYAEKKGILCVNYLNEDTEIDYDIDFWDTTHLNVTGMRIITDEVGELLSGLGLKDHRYERQAEQWNQAYENYMQFRIMKLKEIQNAKSFLSAINDPDLISTIHIYEGILGNVQISKLIERLKSEGHQVVVTGERIKALSEDEMYERYDVFCEVYHRSNLETAIQSIGFIY